ncbi:MAG: hypothetical protein KDK70_08340 [Myxococcales bacterium]|nr:hypothetical protein [Myxococcales bacterium]
METDLRGLLARQELFVRGSHRWHRFTADDLAHGTTAWFGVGVVAGGKLSRGLPLDVLGLLYAQELVRRTMGWKRSLVLVADSNAQAAGLDVLAVRRLSIQIERSLREVCARLGFPVDVRTASSLGRPRALPGFGRLERLPPYVAHQLAQTEHLRLGGAGLKIGWAWPGALHDERYFDDLHAREYGRPIASVYTAGGTTLDPRRPRACPYACSDPSARLLLRSDEDLERRLATASRLGAQRYQRLLGKLTRAHCRLLGTPRPRRLTTPLQDLLDDLPCPG